MNFLKNIFGSDRSSRWSLAKVHACKAEFPEHGGSGKLAAIAASETGGETNNESITSNGVGGEEKASRPQSRRGRLWRRHSRTQSSDGRKISKNSLPPSLPPPPLGLPLALQLPSRPDIHRLSSLDQLAQGYSSGSASPEPDSIFGPYPTPSQSKFPSPASTISKSSFECDTIKLSLPPTLDTVNRWLEPEQLNSDTAAAVSDGNTPNRTKGCLSVQDVQRMQGNLLISSGSSSLYDVAESSSTPDEAFAGTLSDLEGSKRLSDIVKTAQEDFLRFKETLQEEVQPPPVVPATIRVPAIPAFRATVAAKSTSAVPTSSKPQIRAISLPSTPRRPETSPLNTATPPRSAKWHGKQPLRTDSFTFPPTPTPSSAHPPTSWPTTHARFMHIFDPIPSNLPSAPRENPKFYNMRKRRALLELGLMERDLIEVPTTARGMEIMALLDKMEVRLAEERRLAKRRAEMEARSVRTERKARGVRVMEVGAHCVNDVRNGFGPVYVRGEEQERGNGKGMWKEKRGRRPRDGKRMSLKGEGKDLDLKTKGGGKAVGSRDKSMGKGESYSKSKSKGKGKAVQ